MNDLQTLAGSPSDVNPSGPNSPGPDVSIGGSLDPGHDAPSGDRGDGGDGGVSMLARGGLVTHPTVAHLGEKGPEMVVPLRPGMPLGHMIQLILQRERQRGKL